MTQLHTADFLPAFEGLIPAFPAHSLTRKKRVLTEGGAWLVEHQEAQHRRFHSFLLYDQEYIQQRQQEEELKDELVLDGYFLLNCAKLDDPHDICSVDISNKGLNAAKEDDFELFNNLFHINAAENNLRLECLSSFPMVREIQFQFNSLSKVKLTPYNFLHLDTLDLSYNQVTHSAILNIGLIERLRVLVLTANDIKTLPSNMAYPVVDGEQQVHMRFNNLEELYLDNNHLCDLSTFATLGALRKLKYLNLAKNHIYYIPHLRVLGSAIAHVESTPVKSPKSGCSGRSSTKSRRSPHTAGSKQKQVEENEEFGLTKSRIVPQSGGKPTEEEESPVEDDELRIRDEKPLSREIQTGDKSETPRQLESPGTNLGYVNSSSGIPGPGSIKSGMMERDINKAESPDAIRKNKLNVDAYLISEGKSTADTTFQTAPMPLQQPFPQLQTLILSDNAISEEEGVLSCALWPKLCQLVLHNNPVITQCRGLPVLLTHELTLRNGITIIRNPPTKVKKPSPVTVSVNQRKVKEPPRPLPRMPHPDLLALECSPALSLPPPTTAGTCVTETTAPPSPVPEEEQGTGEEAVFLTQVDDQDYEDSDHEEDEDSEPDIISYSASTVHLPDKYKGFEELVDVEDDPDDIIPAQIQSAVISLKKALQKELILPNIYKPVCNSERLPRKQQYRSYKGVRMIPKGKKIDKDKPIASGLDRMKTQVVTNEGDLTNFISNENRKIKSEGHKLLTQIQQRYDKVRNECLQQRSNLLEDIKTKNASLDSSFTLDAITGPSLSILQRTQASTYDSDRASNTPFTFPEDNETMSRESSQYTF